MMRGVQLYSSAGVPLVPAAVRARLPDMQISRSLADLLQLPRDLRIASLDAGWADHQPEGLNPFNVSRPDVAQEVLAMIGDSLTDIADVQPFISLSEAAPPPSEWPLSARPGNALGRARLLTTEAIRPVTVDRLIQIRHFGLKSLLEVLCVGEQLINRGFTPVASPVLAGLEDAQASLWQEVRSAIEHVADWGAMELGARRLGEILDLRVDPTAPEELHRTVEGLARLRLGDLRPVGETSTYDVADIFSRMLARIDARDLHIVRLRLLVDQPPTLDQVGADMGLTRERVRQLQQRALALVTEAFSRGPLHRLGAGLRRSLGSMFKEGDAADSILGQTVARLRPSDPELGLVLVLTAVGYRRRDGWWVADHAPGQDKLRSSLLAKADHAGIITDEDFDTLMDEFDVLLPWRWALLDRWAQVRRINGGWLRWDGAIVDKLVRLVSIGTQPQTPEELLTSSGEPHSPRTVRNQIFADPRVVRIDRAGRVAPIEWGMPEYGGVIDALLEQITAAGGEIDVHEAAERIAAAYGVSIASVRAYSGSPMFMVAGGIVRLRREDEPWTPGDSTQGQQGIHVLGNTVAVVRPVNQDMVRGSGLPISMEAAHALGVRLNGSREFASQDGDAVTVRISSRAFNASMSSLRAVAQRLAARAGDHMALRFDTAQGDVRITRLTREDPEEQWMEAVLDGGGRDELAASIGLEEPEALEEALMQRGDTVFAAALRRTVSRELIEQARDAADQDATLERAQEVWPGVVARCSSRTRAYDQMLHPVRLDNGRLELGAPDEATRNRAAAFGARRFVKAFAEMGLTFGQIDFVIRDDFPPAGERVGRMERLRTGPNFFT